MKNLDNSIKVVESPKILNLMCYFCQKNPFLQLKHYFQGIYLTLLSTNSMKIHQSPYLIFETISYFSGHNSSVFFQLKYYILSSKQPIKIQIFRLSTAHVKVHQIPHVLFKQKVSFYSKFGSFFSVMRDNSSVHFQLKVYMLLTREGHQIANFQTSYSSH